MRQLPLLIILLSLSVYAAAQTYVKDGSDVSGTWTPKGSPYIIEGEAIVPAGEKLKIKPGTIVKFKTGEERDYDFGNNENFDLGFLRVNGTLIAKGKKSKMVTFTRDGSFGYWGIILIDSRSKKNQIKYCKLSYGYHVRNVVLGDNGTAVISFYKSQGKILNNLIVNNGWTGINCKEGATPVIRNNTVVNNNYGIECNSGSSPHIVNTIVWNNNTSFYVNPGASPKISYSLIEDMSLDEEIKDGGKNILGEDPQFVDWEYNDFNLKDGSPCKGSGEKGKNMGAL